MTNATREYGHKCGRDLYASAFNTLPHAACIIEPVGESTPEGRDWSFNAVNPAMQRLFAIEDLSGLTLHQRFARFAPQWQACFERVVETGTAETLIRSIGSNPKIYEFLLSPLAGSAGQGILAEVRDITGKQAAQASRRDADARYRTLFNAIDEGFCVVQVVLDHAGEPIDYRFLEVNQAFVDQTGLTDPVGKRMRELQPDIEDHWSAIYGRIARTGVAERFESESPAMGRWFDVFAFPIGDSAPYLVGILFEDVGIRKAMELALRHSENRLHSLIKATSDLIFRGSPDWSSIQRIDGTGSYSDGEGGADWIARYIRDDDRQMVTAALQAAINKREAIALEHRVRKPDGSMAWLSSRAIPVLDDRGEIIEWFGMATDITDRRDVEDQLAHGAQMLRVASEIGKVGLWDWNLENDKLTWSDEHFRMKGFKVGEVTPSYAIWAERIHPDDRAEAEAKIVRARETGTDYAHEYRVCHPDGQIHWLSARGGFLYDSKGVAVRMLGAMVDTTERRQQEEWHKLLVAELQHRVRNLISMVRSVARLSASSHRTVDDYVDHLIGRLQAMGRTQGTLTRSPGTRVDLAEMVREELLVHAANPDQCMVDGPDIALSPHAAEIVTLAIHELATNSVKYGALGIKGYIRISWTLSARDEKPWVHLAWRETCARPVTRTRRNGFGRRLIEERVPYELQGEGQLQVHDTGVLARLSFPLANGSSILETGSRKARTL